MALAAILFDLGDVLMREESEWKVDGITRRADLLSGMADLLRELKGGGKRLGLVADTRAGTFRNVLEQYGLYELFDAFAISELLGVEKPDRRIFLHALAELGIPPGEWWRVAMVGNNLARYARRQPARAHQRLAGVERALPDPSGQHRGTAALSGERCRGASHTPRRPRA